MPTGKPKRYDLSMLIHRCLAQDSQGDVRILSEFVDQPNSEIPINSDIFVLGFDFRSRLSLNLCATSSNAFFREKANLPRSSCKTRMLETSDNAHPGSLLPKDDHGLACFLDQSDCHCWSLIHKLVVDACLIRASFTVGFQARTSARI